MRAVIQRVKKAEVRVDRCPLPRQGNSIKHL